jgi:crotonobetainyl-CoA hydratase
MPYEFIQLRREGPVTVVTLNRPEVLNALHAAAQFELDAILDAFASDPDQWVAVITGAGDRAFCSGGDLKALAADGARSRPAKGFGGLTSRFDLEKPLIAAVNGVAYGGGFEAALACDIILASETATFALPEPRRGLAAFGGGVHRLTRDIGPKRAMGMILTARAVSAAEGLRLGFVTEVTPAAELLPTAMRWAEEICRLSPMAVQASKDLAYRGLDEPSLEAAMKGQRAYPAVRALIASGDYREGPRAFAEKRAPVWKGR